MLRPTALLGVTTLLPAAAWSLLALGMAALMPHPAEKDRNVPVTVWQRDVTPIVRDGPHPCTGTPAALDATVETRVTFVADPDNARVEIEAAFDNVAGATASGRLAPVVERFTVVRPHDIAREVEHVHRFPVPLVDGLSGGYLAVTLVAAVAPDGPARVAPPDLQLVCFAAEDESVRR
jgi:hypothetical protein